MVRCIQAASGPHPSGRRLRRSSRRLLPRGIKQYVIRATKKAPRNDAAAPCEDLESLRLIRLPSEECRNVELIVAVVLGLGRTIEIKTQRGRRTLGEL
jgi:hypothetical protein